MNRKRLTDVVLLCLICLRPICAKSVEVDKISPPFFSKIALEINGSRQLLDGNLPIEVVQGDLVVLIDAWTSAANAQLVDSIDLLGYSPRSVKNVRDDRFFVIHTGTNLQAKFALNDAKSDFELRGYIRGEQVGRAMLRLVPARLERVELSLNGNTRFLRDGDVLVLTPKDRIAVKTVVTNIRGNEDVHHEIKTKKGVKGDLSRELLFARQGKVFGRIPIKWQE